MAVQVETVGIDEVFQDPANVRKHGDRNIETIANSLRRFGQQKPIIVDASGMIVAGNGTHEAAKRIGWTSIRIVRSGLQGAERTAYAIADNRSAELAEWDEPSLLAQLQLLGDVDLSALGFDEVDLSVLSASGEDVDAPESFPEVDESIPVDHECPKCGYKWSGGQ